jgi:hypothetical protein
MRSTTAAEWILTPCVGRSRATSLVGDLLEMMPDHGTLWFWRSVAGVVLALTWRRALAFYAALRIGLWALGGLSEPIWGAAAPHRPPEEWMPLFKALSIAGLLLSFAAPYAAIRFGLRDVFSRQILCAWSLCALPIFYWWVPGAPLILTVLAAAFVVHSLISPPYGKALAFLTAALCVATLGGLSTFYVAALISRSHRPVLESTLWGCLYLWSSVLIQTSVYSRAHHLLTQSRPDDVLQVTGS